MDSTLLFWTMWTIFILYQNFVFYLMTHLYRRYGSALGGSDISIINVTKQKQPPLFLVFKHIVKLNYVSAINTTC